MPPIFTSLDRIYEIFELHPQVVTDSRLITSGCLFFGLIGEIFNGNTFAEKAIQQGAAFSIIDDPIYQLNDQYLLVENVLLTLQALATKHRRQFGIPVLAITGSNGKTTTKELVNTVLSSHYMTHSTKGNFNNHVGVPLTLLSMKKDTEVAVIEMGANHPGEIETLCKIAEPTLGLITNVGKAHLEGFGSFEGVKATKSELYRYLAKHDGLIFLNTDEPHLTGLSSGNEKKIKYGKSPSTISENGIEIKLLQVSPFISVSFESENGLIEVRSQLVGEYNFGNIATAITLGIYFKVPANKIKEAIENYAPANMRSQIIQIGTNTFLLDAYNANPTSMKSALNSYQTLEAESKWVILGSMLELGIFAEEEHEYIAQLACDSGFQEVILIGKEFQKAAFNKEVLWFENTASLKEWFNLQEIFSTHILIKGSRSIGLEKLLDGN